MPHSSNNSPIDAVITWVDGSDPVHRAKRMAALKEKPGKGDIPIAAGRNTHQLFSGRIQKQRTIVLCYEK